MLRFQAIDTPGILDHPLEEMNTIEMQSITAIAHLRSAILYFMDLSEQCGYSVQAQMALFASIKPLFANKLVFVVINKIDVMKMEDLDAETHQQLQDLCKSGNVEILQTSCATTEGVMNVRNVACDRLLAERNAAKLAAGTNSSGEVTGRLGDVLKRIHVAQPMGGIVREAFIPEGALNRMKYDKDDPDRPKLMRDIEEEEGGTGVFNINLKEKWLLENDDWKQDKMPEMLDGKNVYDYVDPDIESKLAALEEEEARLEAEGYYDGDEPVDDADQAETRYKAELIREKRQLIRNDAKMRKSLKNRAVIPRSRKAVDINKMDKGLTDLGFDTTSITERARARSQSRARGRSVPATPAEDGDAMDVDSGAGARKRSISRAMSQNRSQSRMNRREDGVTDEVSKEKAERLAKLGQKKMNRMARQGEADRHTTAAKSKWLLAGKRGMGSTRSR